MFVVGGTSAVREEWRDSNIDIDLADVAAMVSRGLITAAGVRAQFALMEAQLYRFPAIDPATFRRAVDARFPPGPECRSSSIPSTLVDGERSAVRPPSAASHPAA